MPHLGRSNIYEATIKRMVTQAPILKHTPWPRELVGKSLIERRFGTWQNALSKAKLPMRSTPDKVSGFGLRDPPCTSL